MPLDLVSYDYLDTYQPPAGMVRISVVKGWGFTLLKKMLVNDIPDVYCLVSLGGSSPPFRTSTVWDDCSPSWDESCDFVLYDMDQKIYVDVYDDDPTIQAGTPLGKAEITVRDLFRERGATADLELMMDDKRTGCFIKISADMFHLSNQLHSLSSLKYEGENHVCGLVTIIVTRAFGIPLTKEEAASYVKVEYGGESGRVRDTFLTSTMPYDLEPMYNGAFHLPLTVDMMKQEDSLDDGAAAAAMALGGGGSLSMPASRRRNPSTARSNPLTQSIAMSTKQTSKMASSMLKTSMSIVESAVHWKDQSKKDIKRNDIVFTLMNGDDSNSKSHRKIGSFAVTHNSLVKAYNHTITERRPIGQEGASLEFRVVLSGMQSEDERSRCADNPSSRTIQQSMCNGKGERRSIRVTALKGRGFVLGTKRVNLGKNVVLRKKTSVPDVYCRVRLNSAQQGTRSESLGWRTSTVKDDTMPKWNEEKIFVTTNPSRDAVRVDAYDERKTKDRYLGSAEYPLEKLLRKRTMEIELRNEGEPTGSFVTLKCVQLANVDEEEIEEDDDSLVDFDNVTASSPHESHLSHPTSKMITKDGSLDSSSTDSEAGDVFTQSVTRMLSDTSGDKTRPHEGINHRKALMRKLSLPVNMTENVKEKLSSQLSNGYQSFDHAKELAKGRADKELAKGRQLFLQSRRSTIESHDSTCLSKDH